MLYIFVGRVVVVLHMYVNSAQLDIHTEQIDLISGKVTHSIRAASLGQHERESITGKCI